MRQRAEVYLRVVGGEQLPLGPPLGNERTAHAQPKLGAHRYVLELGVVARQPPCRRTRLVIRRVDAARAQVHLERQRVHVGRLQLRKSTVVQDVIDDRVDVAESLQDRRVGRVALLRLASARQPPFLEQQVPELGRRVDVELVPHCLVRRPLRRLDLNDQLLVELRQHRCVDGYAVDLDLRQHRHERHRVVTVERREAVPLEIRRQRAHELERRVDVLTRELCRRVDRHGVETDLLAAGPDEVAERLQLDIQPVERELLHFPAPSRQLGAPQSSCRTRHRRSWAARRSSTAT